MLTNTKQPARPLAEEKITVIAFELAKTDADSTMKICHQMMSDFGYSIHIPSLEKGFALPFPSNVLASTSRKETPSVMAEKLRLICGKLGVKLIKCIAFVADTEGSVGLSAIY